MAASTSNKQGERELVAEWITTLPATWKSKTQVKVGADPLFYGGKRLTPAQSRANGVWSDWADARIVTQSEVWIVEGKLIALAAAYGQVIDYLDQYPTSDDYKQFAPLPIVGVVVAQATRPRLSELFARWGIRTIQFTPRWSLADSLDRIFPGNQVAE